MRKNEPSNFIGVELPFKKEGSGKVEMLRDVVQTELSDIERSSQMGLVRKRSLEEGPLGCIEETLVLASEEAE